MLLPSSQFGFERQDPARRPSPESSAASFLIRVTSSAATVAELTGIALVLPDSVRVRRTAGVAIRNEAEPVLGRERIEQLDVLGLVASKMQERCGAVIVTIQVSVYMVEDERQNEYLDMANCIEIAVTPNLVEHELFLAR